MGYSASQSISEWKQYFFCQSFLEWGLAFCNHGAVRAWWVSNAGAVRITAVFLPTKHNCTINYYSGNTHISWVVWSQLGCCCSVISPGAHSSALIKSSWQRSCVVINSSLTLISPQHFVVGVVFFWKLHSEAVFFCLCGRAGYYLCYYCLYLLDFFFFFSAIECISLCQLI